MLQHVGRWELRLFSAIYYYVLSLAALHVLKPILLQVGGWFSAAFNMQLIVCMQLV